MNRVTPLLAIDAGNTRIKWGIHDGAWRETGAVLTTEVAAIGSTWRSIPRATSAIASNVAGREVARLLQDACGRVGMELRVITSKKEQLGVVSLYKDPAQLGTDRWAALIAAHRAGPGHKLVVNVGTALTIDALAADGRFLGGLIVPGPALMRRSLDRGTAGLRLTEGELQPFPRNTQDAITSGAIHAAAGAVERLREIMAREGCAPERALVSGGAAEEVATHLSLAVDIRENLVLDGLALIAREP